MGIPSLLMTVFCLLYEKMLNAGMGNKFEFDKEIIMIPISDILIRSISGYVFMVPVFVLYSCGSKNWGEHKVFSIPLQCLFWLLFIRTFDRHRHRLYKHNDLSPEHFLDSIYRYDNWAN